MTREHGTHACYVFGPAPGAGKGCRCDACRAGHSRYEYQRATSATPPYIDAQPVREHVENLRRAGVGLKTIAARSGVAHGALAKLMHGEPSRGMGPSKRVRPATAEKLYRVTAADAAPDARIPAGPSLAVVDELLRRGWAKAAIARAIGQKGPGLQIAKRGQTIHARTARALAALLDQPVPPTGRGRHGYIASTWDPGAERAEAMRKAAQAERRQSYRLIERGDIEDAPSLDPGPGDLLARGECRRRTDVPTWLFFPTDDDRQTIAKARKVCESCPVAAECRQWAIDHGEQGIWGGTTEAERAQRIEDAS